MTHNKTGTESVQPKILPLQLIVGAMIGGLVAVAVIARWLVQSEQMSTSPNLADILLTVLAIYSLTMVIAFAVVKKVLTRRFRASSGKLESEQPSADSVLELFSQLTVIGAAFTEGCGLFGVVSHLLSGSWMALFFPAICAALLVTRFPSKQRYTDFHASLVGATPDTPISP
jgi:Flp pilus assembly pilin Flp